MLAVCQIPEDILKNMTTEALLQTVLSYPFISDYYAFNSYKDAAKTFENDFNGFKELFNRSDLTTVLLNTYENSTYNGISAQSQNNSYKSEFFFISNLEFLFAYDQLTNGDYSQTEAEKFDKLFMEKKKERANINELSENSEIYSNFMAQESPIQPYGITYYTIYTPKGSSVSVMNISPDLTTAEKTELNNYFDKAYPNATRKASATKNYNCHSYAWYSQSTNNTYWMNDPSKYMSDGSYKLHTDLRPRVGFKAYYYNGNHTAVVQEIKMVDGSQTFWYQSKWGQAGLYYHTLYYSPYATGVDHYYKSAS